MPEEVAGVVAAEPEAPVEPVETEQPVEPAEPTEPVEPAAGEEPAPEGEQPEQAPESPTQEPLPKDVQRALRELRQNPQNATIARTLQDAYYKGKAYAEAFPTVEDARWAKATIEALGGADGIVQMRENADLLDSIDQRIDQGDPTVIEDAFESSPEGAARIIEHGIQQFSQRDPAGFAKVIQPILLRAITSSGIADRLNYAAEFLDGGQTEMAAKQLGAIISHLNQLSEEASRQPARQPAPAPAPQQGDREMDLNRRELIMSLGPHLETTIGADIRQLAGNRKLDDAAIGRLRDMVVSEMDAAASKDAAYQSNLNAYLRRGDVQGAVNFAKVNADRIRGQIVRNIWRQMYGSAPAAPAPRTARAAAPANGNGQTGTAAPSPASDKPLRIAKRPESQDIDLDRSPLEMRIAGRAYLKDGRYVQWRINRP